MALRSLEFPNSESIQLLMGKQYGIYERFKEKLALDQIFREIYHVPEASNLKSVDSFIIIGNVLVLFQITRNAYHPVAAEGIVDLMRKLDKLKEMKAGEMTVQLVFVVPIQMSATYRPQPVENQDVFNLSFEDLRASDCRVVPNIAEKKKRKLNDLGISNVGELMDADATTTSFVRSAVDKLKLDLLAMQELTFLSSMKQFVLGVDYSQ
jgi:hypothetical protein